MKTHSVAALFFASSLTAAAADVAPGGGRPSPDGGPETIAALDVPRYMGTWFEIAKFPNRFQKKCAGGTRAEYSLLDDGMVRVVNRCRLESGETIDAEGAARQSGPATSPKLEVRFAPRWLSFLPFVWGDYWVVDLDEQYRLAAVSEPKREYLWILSRTPTVPAEDYQRLLARLEQKGFDLGRLVATRQD